MTDVSICKCACLYVIGIWVSRKSKWRSEIFRGLGFNLDVIGSNYHRYDGFRSTCGVYDC